MSTPKQIIILRKDLNMRKGKMVAQGAHASIAAILNVMQERSVPSDFHRDNYDDEGLFLDQRTSKPLNEWLAGSFTKICVSVDSEDELIQLYKEAEAKGILCSLIKDAGHTEFGGVPTYTAVAIGPDYPEVVDPLTRHLKLL